MALLEVPSVHLDRWIIVSEEDALSEAVHLPHVESTLVLVDLTEVVFILPEHVERLFGAWLSTLRRQRPRTFGFLVSTVATRLALQRLARSSELDLNVIWCNR
jgi:hypothetical protein